MMVHDMPRMGKDKERVSSRTQTEFAVLQLIQREPSISRVELAQRLGLSTANITGVVGGLVEKKFLVEEMSSAKVVGRRRISLTMHPDLGNVVGVDIGTFNLRIAITDLNGKLLGYREEATEMWRGREAALNRCFQLIDQALADAGVARSSVLGIGVAFSGVIDVARGMVLSYPRLGHAEQWKNVPLKQLVEDYFGIPCLLEDSARAVATSECFLGAGQNFRDFVYVDAGMGIGASIFIGGSIYRGFNGSAGEFGHMTVDENGPLCLCGNNGCLEAMASSATIIEAVRRALSKGVISKTLEMAGNDMDRISIEIIAQAAEENDSLAFRVLSEAASHIGASAADLVNLLNPEAIIFGGALFRAAPVLLLDQIRRVVRQRAMEKAVNDVQLLISPLSTNAGAVGAARLTAAALMESVHNRGAETAIPTMPQQAVHAG
ncbi:ROK family transcriptional regulator [Terriglobus tenax]|uniref:ROK family transcriptional regulator n=1 Tax=Terriglobus tenax TaxID=1111115 RepID=UPI0021E04985|nr:ROK family transcriptional regulator [Terriglobus tenax]